MASRILSAELWEMLTALENETQSYHDGLNRGAWKPI